MTTAGLLAHGLAALTQPSRAKPAQWRISKMQGDAMPLTVAGTATD